MLQPNNSQYFVLSQCTVAPFCCESQEGPVLEWTSGSCWRRVSQWVPHWAEGWEVVNKLVVLRAAQTPITGPTSAFNGSPINNLNRWEGNRQGFLVQVIIQYEKCTTVTHLETLRFPSDGIVDFNYLCMTDVKWEYSYCHTLHDWLQCPRRVRKLQLTF